MRNIWFALFNLKRHEYLGSRRDIIVDVSPIEHLSTEHRSTEHHDVNCRQGRRNTVRVTTDDRMKMNDSRHSSYANKHLAINSLTLTHERGHILLTFS